MPLLHIAQQFLLSKVRNWRPIRGHSRALAKVVGRVVLKGSVTLCYVLEMESTTHTPQTTIDGLVDNRGAAAILDVDVNTFKVWGTRSRTALNGIPAMMPSPVGTLHGNVYRAEDIRTLKAELNKQHPVKSANERRSLGSYFTPSDAVELMVAWAVRCESERILEPSLGDGSFLSAVNRYAASRGWATPQSVASELDQLTAQAAVESGSVQREKLLIGDFLTHKHDPVDVVIGNPPYVRIRALDKKSAVTAMTAAERSMGEPMDPAGSVWMPFVSKSTMHLKLGGRMAFVLPLDLTYVKYARPLWRFLGRHFRHLSVLRFKQRVFPEILQNVLILFAEGKGGMTNHVNFVALESASEYDASHIALAPKIPLSEICDGRRPFQEALLSTATRQVYSALKEHSEPAKSRVKFNIGYVSGNKKFFHPSPADIANFNIPESNLLPTAVSTRQLSGGGLRTSSTEATQHLWLAPEKLSPGEEIYVKQGEDSLVDQAYKCRIRRPWYVVPGVKRADLFLSVFSDQPRLYINDSSWVASNSVLCGYLRPGERADTFAASWYSALTLLSSELEVHSLGGGVMIAVPNEADAIRVLSSGSTLGIIEQGVNEALRNNQTSKAYEAGNASLDALVGQEGLQLIWEGIEALGAWRKSVI